MGARVREIFVRQKRVCEGWRAGLLPEAGCPGLGRRGGGFIVTPVPPLAGSPSEAPGAWRRRTARQRCPARGVLRGHVCLAACHPEAQYSHHYEQASSGLGYNRDALG